MLARIFTQEKCPKCPHAKQILRQVAEKHNLEVEEVRVDTQDGLITALMHQITATPTIMIGNKIVCRGEIPNPEQLEEEICKLKASST